MYLLSYNYKNMKDTMTISLEKELKESFARFAKSLGTNPTNLLNMMMVHSLNTKSITFEAPQNFFELEQFSNSELKDLQDSFKIRNGLEEIESLLENV